MIISFFLFLLGLPVGSFLNVLIERLPKEESIIRPRSYCDSCRHPLSGRDLIPVVSWIWLNGRCRYCRSPIPFQYPLVELLTGAIFVFVYNFYNSYNLYIFLAIFSSFIVIFFSDLKYGIIPDQIIFFLVLISLFFYFPVFPFGKIVSFFFAGLITAFLFLLLVIITKFRGMGLGDVKLAFVMGFILGWPKIIVALYFAFLTGAFLGVILILGKKKKIKDKIAFGPFLAAGTILALFFGEKILKFFHFL